jgi:hypothetical protein
MACWLRCPRAHYWQYEIGLRKASTSIALIIGSAWHRAMEARWKGADYETAFSAALPPTEEIDVYAAATIAGLLSGYYKYWIEDAGIQMFTEVKFAYNLESSRTFTVEGMIDRMGDKSDGRKVLCEYKTTGDSVAPDSEYWLRLKFNSQIYQYWCAAKEMGWDIDEVIYDVTRKPSIRPKMINNVDENGDKIVLDVQGNRAYLKNGKPRQSGSEAEGLTVSQHLETPDEYRDRLEWDCTTRPDFYFARKEVPILEEDIEDFKSQRLSIARALMHSRNEAKKLNKPERAYPRAVSEQNCKFCTYKSFCLQNLSVDVENPPIGFSIQPFNPELADASTEEPATTE